VSEGVVLSHQFPPLQFNYPNNILQEVQMAKLLIMQFFSFLLHPHS